MSMMPVLSREMGQQICDAIGVAADGVTSIEIKAEVGDAARVVIERFLDREEGKKLIQVLKAYRWEQSK